MSKGFQFSTSRKDSNLLTGKHVRRADNIDDIEFVKQLANEYTEQFFGKKDPAELLCKSYISLCLDDSENQLVAAICANDHPNIPALPPWEWLHWNYTIYRLDSTTPRNTLWVHLAVWNDEYTHVFLRPLLEALFELQPFLEYIMFVVPPGVGHLEWVEPHATRIMSPENPNPRKVQTLFLTVRQHFVPKYKIRRAVEEDNDDLVPLIDEYSKRLRELYGEFYVAELITKHPNAGRQLIVAEHDGVAVAVLCLNDNINQDVLNESFELVPFNGLRKPDDQDSMLEHEHEAGSVSLLPKAIDETRFQHVNDFCHDESENASIVTFDSEPADRITGDQSDDSDDDDYVLDLPSFHMEDEITPEDDVSVETKESQFSCVALTFNEYDMHLFMDAKKGFGYDDTDMFSSKASRKTTYQPNIPKYHGEENAFVLEISASQTAHENASIHLLLEAAFECFPDRDYCVLTVPSTRPSSALLQYFVRVPPRPVSTFPHELYILHRNGIASRISVHNATRSDVYTVQELVRNLPKSTGLLSKFISAVDDETWRYKAFILFSEQQAVGVAIVRAEDEVEYLQSHYQLDQWIDVRRHKTGSHGLIKFLTMSPIFQRHAKFFLREIHRLSDFSTLYYKLTPDDTSAHTRERPLACVLSELIPVLPRMRREFTQTNLEGCAPDDVICRTVDPPFALYLSTGRHCTLPIYEINTRIVLVGTGDCALAFLASLLCNWSRYYLARFCNVTVISPHGLNYQRPEDKVRDMLFVTRGRMNYRKMQLISLRTYINIINGVATSIDRKNKRVTVNDETLVAYDILFLMCGKQFQQPSNAQSRKEDKKAPAFPKNVFIINTEVDGANALGVLQSLAATHHGHIIVYGHALDAYCCLASLLEFGIPGSDIVFVEPFPSIDNSTAHGVSIFNDADVEDAAQDAIKAEGITVHTSYYFSDWTYAKDSGAIVSAKFESKHKLIEVPCKAMFLYCQKSVSNRTYSAINKAGLVFDGALVIGRDFRTNDHSIYGAGTLTKYSRRYYADDLAHTYFNMEEIGYKLGLHIRGKLIPHPDAKNLSEEFVSHTGGDMLVPTFDKPLSNYCRLPGQLRYLSVTKPGKVVPLEVAMSSENYGQVLMTGDAKKTENQGYFRLHLNEYGVVETITCLAKCDIDHLNLTSIWGKHKRFLNNVLLRFEMGLIPDLFDYFREPWTCAIYHDRFVIVEDIVNTILTSPTTESGKPIIDDILNAMIKNNWKKGVSLVARICGGLSYRPLGHCIFWSNRGLLLNPQLKRAESDELDERVARSEYREMIEQKVLDFLHKNYSFLPMYAHPMIVRLLLQGYENSPLFSAQ